MASDIEPEDEPTGAAAPTKLKTVTVRYRPRPSSVQHVPEWKDTKMLIDDTPEGMEGRVRATTGFPPARPLTYAIDAGDGDLVDISYKTAFSTVNGPAVVYVSWAPVVTERSAPSHVAVSQAEEGEDEGGAAPAAWRR